MNSIIIKKLISKEHYVFKIQHNLSCLFYFSTYQREQSKKIIYARNRARTFIYLVAV